MYGSKSQAKARMSEIKPSSNFVMDNRLRRLVPNV